MPMRIDPISKVELNRLSSFNPGQPRRETPQRQQPADQPRAGETPARPWSSDNLTLSLAGIAALIDDFLMKNPPQPDGAALFYAGVRRDLPKLAAAGITELAIERDAPVIDQVAARLAGLPDLPVAADPGLPRIGPDHPLFRPQTSGVVVSIDSIRLQAETRLHQLGAGPAPVSRAAPATRAAMAAYGQTLRDLGELAGLPGAGVIPPLPQERSMEVHALKSLAENLRLLSGAGIAQLKVAEGADIAGTVARRAGTLTPGLGEIRPIPAAR